MPPSTSQNSNLSTLSFSLFSDKASELEEDMESIWLHDDPPSPNDQRMIEITRPQIIRDPFQRFSVGSHECSRACLEVHRKLRIKCLSLIISARVSIAGSENDWFAIKSRVIESLLEESADFDSILEPVHVQFIDSASAEVVEQWSLTFNPPDTYVELDHVHQHAVVLLRCLQVHLVISPTPSPTLNYVLSKEACHGLKSRTSLPVLLTPHAALQIMRHFHGHHQRRPSRTCSNKSSNSVSNSQMVSGRLEIVTDTTPIASLEHIVDDLDEFERAIELACKEPIEEGQLIDGKAFRQQITELVEQMDDFLRVRGASSNSKELLQITANADKSLLNKKCN